MTSLRCFWLFLVTFATLWNDAAALKWLALATSGTLPLYHHDDCPLLSGFSRKQVKICRRQPKAMDSVRAGAEVALSECQHQFRNSRWNCSFTQAGFGGSRMQGTRETAFVHALSAASVAHSVSKACTKGNLNDCGCDRTLSGNSQDGFEWAGCSDNAAYGVAFSERFVDARERLSGKHVVRGLVNVHNNKAGRKTVLNHMTTHCKCHGVSGSCEIKTCWRAMPSFRTLGSLIKQKFDYAAEVTRTKDESRVELTRVNVQLAPHTDSDLVYVTPSPDFCDADPQAGTLGTKGRKCVKDSQGSDGCGLLCCGRGFVTKTRVVIDTCGCKFHWCCEVKCQKCEKVLEEHFCR